MTPAAQSVCRRVRGCSTAGKTVNCERESVDKQWRGWNWRQVAGDQWSHLVPLAALTIVTFGLGISGLSLWYTSRHLEFLTSRNDLISAHKRYLQLDEAYAKTFHGLDQVAVVAESPKLEDTKAFVRQLGEQLQADTAHVQDVLYYIDTSSLEGKKLLLLSPEDLRKLRAHIEDAQEVMLTLAAASGLNTLLTAINQKISAAMVSHLAGGLLGLSEAEKTTEKKLLSLAFLQALLRQMDSVLSTGALPTHSSWAEFFGDDAFDSEGFLVSDDKRLVFLAVAPRTHGGGFDALQDTITTLRAHIAELRTTFPQVEAGVTGDAVLGNDEMLAAQADTGTATLLSLTGVTLLYVLFFRSIRRPLLIALSVVIGLTWTVGFLTLTVGHVSVLSIFVAPILIGLCDAYGVYFVTRYEEERNLGAPVFAALWTAGAMWLFGIQFNVANLVALPLLIGVGVDGGINLIRRAREEGLPGWAVIGGSTGQAIALYSLDSIAGFGSLLVARHAGVFSMGLLLVLAVGAVLLATLAVLPLLLGARELKTTSTRTQATEKDNGSCLVSNTKPHRAAS